MIADRIRRLAVLVLALALSLGPVMHAGAMADMSMKMAAADSGVAMPDGCDDCSGDPGTMSATACFSYCASPGVILASPPIMLSAAVSVPREPAGAAAIDRHPPPDPYPPRPVVLG